MTTAARTRSLDDAIAHLRDAAGDDPRAAAILAWAETHDRALLKTIGVVYRNDLDEALRRLGRAASEFVDNDPHTPFYEDGPLQLNLAASTYRIGDRVKALDYLTRAVQNKPDWRANPVIIDFAAALMDVPPELAATMIGTPGAESAFNVAKGAGWWQDRALGIHSTSGRAVARNLLLYAIGIMLLAALTIHIAATLWLPQARLVRTAPMADLLDSLREPARWVFANEWLVAGLIGLAAALDVLARGFALHLAAVLADDAQERSFLALFPKLLTWQKVIAVLSVGALCAIFVLSAMSLSGIRNSTVAALQLAQTFFQLRIWLIASVVAYVVLIGRLLMETYRFGIARALLVLLAASLVVTALEALLAGGILSLVRR